MVIVELSGGLGNQLFEYAAARCLSEKLQVPLKLDLATLLDRNPNKEEGFVFRDYDLGIFRVQENFATPQAMYWLTGNSPQPLTLGQRLWRKTNHLFQLVNYADRLYKEPHFHYDSAFYEKKAPLYLSGYWQSEQYFKPIESIIRQEFTFRQPLAEHCQPLAQQIGGVATL
jgi:hypothetical protein